MSAGPLFRRTETGSWQRCERCPTSAPLIPPLIESLLDPARYPHPAGPVELVETHISWVLLAGDYAYKFKKPVVLPFLDYGTVDKRRACCEAELRINRRYAPDLYLEVAHFDGEPAVRMRRFAEDDRLDHVCARGELTPDQLSDLARRLAEFHAAAAVAGPAERFGEPAQVLAPALENFDELEHLLPAECGRLARLKSWTLAEHTARRDAFARRKAAGRVRECHGDLHLGNLVLLAGRPTPFDAIEFNDDFRWIDVAAEIAFTYLDLLDHGRPGLAAWFLNEWLLWSGDYDALAVLRFYAVYRAMVRAKVAAIQGKGTEAAEYLAMAEALTVPPPANLTITFGLSGSGKTTAAKVLLLADARAATIRLRSDVERKRLFGLAPDAASGGGIYDHEATVRTYGHLRTLAAEIVADGWPVLVDAAFLKRAERDDFRALAAQLGIPFAILACEAPIDELRRRLATRSGDASEATVQVLEQQVQWMQPLDEGERGVAISPARP
ncbi:MAG: AAA family ATPase [Rhodocyclales bacterium]|nr:AAA family ATPase [Rhodocyclales bacterium]